MGNCHFKWSKKLSLSGTICERLKFSMMKNLAPSPQIYFPICDGVHP